jgi:N-hydroxyarylamine O-acetyltransferase
MLHVPFENLDIHLGRRIVVDLPAFYRKIVDRRRGCFCYELNGLFAWLLRRLGFEVTLHSAQVFDGGEAGPEFDHLILLVHLEQRWLADVGFGDSFLEPLRLDEPGPQEQQDASYRIGPSGDERRLDRRRPDSDWEPRYLFSLLRRELTEFGAMCDYHQTSSESSFTQRRLCTRATETGRVTLSGLRLIITEDGERREIELSGPEEYPAVLRRYFDLSL